MEKKQEIKFKGDNLLKFRKEKGLSQEELANIIGVSRQAIYKWETGERLPDINNLNLLCKEFDKSIEDFIDGATDLLPKEKISEENNEPKKETKKKKSIIKSLFNFVLIIVLLVFAIYMITVIAKSLLFTNLFSKLENYKDVESYRYSEKSYYANFERETESNYIVQCKDGVQNIYGSSDDVIYEAWYYFKTKDEKATYGSTTDLNVEDENGNNKVEYFYQEGFAYSKASPYERAYEVAKENFTLENILNPFYVVKFDIKNNDIILEIYDKDPEPQNVTYLKEVKNIDFDSGLLTKQETYEVDKLTSRTIYHDYVFNHIEGGFGLTNTIKEFIKTEAEKISE